MRSIPMPASRTIALLLALMLGASAEAAGPISFAAGGDMIGPYALVDGADPGLVAIGDIFRKADAAFANQEGAVFDVEQFPGVASGENGGGYPVVSLRNARIVRAMGIKLVSKANNHATDWGYRGLGETMANLKALDFTSAGAGDSEAAARAPAYIATPHGEIALVSAASTFPPMSRAGEPVTGAGRIFARPGINALRAQEVRMIAAEEMVRLRQLAGPVAINDTARPDELRIGDQLFRVGEGTTRWEVDGGDEHAILGAIATARARARLVIFAIHAHETAGHDDDMPPKPFEPMVLHRANEAPSPDDPEPAAFLPDLFHKAIDGGADAVIRTGPHTLGGIEMYKGRPIFYGLGSLFFSFGGRHSYRAPGGQVKQFPESWFETVIPLVQSDGDGKFRVTLYPAIIRSSTGPDDGLPELAHGPQARAILTRVRVLSAPYRTKIAIEGDVGVIRN